MKTYYYELVNVFAESHFGGNPLAVFTDADGLNGEQMQLIARQFNLSEVAFVQAANDKSAVRKLRIFTPMYEMPFAGHPTVGSAFVLHNLLNLKDHYILQTEAGLVELFHQNETITFSLNQGTVENAPLSRAECAEILGLNEADITSEPSWTNTGAAQLLVRLSSADAVKTCQIQTALFLQKARSKTGLPQIYLWSEQNNVANVRLFFGQDGAAMEDPGTGSAAANLGSWCIANGLTPLDWQIRQGDEIGRPNRLTLKVDAAQKIYVGGKVIKVGEGQFFVPSE